MLCKVCIPVLPLQNDTVANLLATNKLSELAVKALYLMYEKKVGRNSFWYSFIKVCPLLVKVMVAAVSAVQQKQKLAKLHVNAQRLEHKGQCECLPVSVCRRKCKNQG